MTFTTRQAFSLLYYLVFVAYGYSGQAVFHTGKRTAGHRALLGTYVSLSLWALALSLSNSAPTEELALLWRKWGVFGWGTMYSLLLHFTLYITRRHDILRRKITWVLLYAPVAVNVYAFLINKPLADAQFNLVQNQYGWVNLYVPTPFNAFHTIYSVVYTGISVLLLVLWYRNNTDQRYRRTAQRFALSFLAAMIISFLLDYTRPSDPARFWPISSVMVILVPATMVLWIARRYHLLSPDITTAGQAAVDTGPADAARRRVYRFMGSVLNLLAYANLFYYVLIHPQATNVMNILKGMLLTALLLLGSEAVLNLNRMRISNHRQELIVAAVCASAILMAHFWFLHSVAETVWASTFLFIIVVIVFRNPRLMLYAVSAQVIYQLYLLYTRPYAMVEVDPADYVARIVFLVVGVSMAYYVNTVYIDRLQENERQNLFQRTIARISLRLTSFKREEYRGNIVYTLQAIREYLDVPCVLHISLRHGTLQAFHTSDTGLAKTGMDDLAAGRMFASIVRELPEDATGFQLLGHDTLSRDPKMRAFMDEHHIGSIAVTRLVRNERMQDALLLVMNERLSPTAPPTSREAERRSDFLRISSNALANYLVRRDAQEQLHYLAYHDQLTGLYKLDRFQELVQREITLHQGSEDLLAVLFVDMDSFKEINDVAGHDVGNMVLKVVAARLLALRDENDYVARFGGDEFLYMTKKPDVGGLRDTAQRIIDIFKEPVAIEQWTFFVSASVGIALYPWDGDDVTSLMNSADYAMYEAKHYGRNRFNFYSPQSKSATHNMVILKNDLRNAITRGEMTLMYQPQVSLKDGRVVGLEALLRWRHPRFGVIAPSTFLPLAEQTDWIHEMGRWVLETACAQGKIWLDQGFPGLRISVNASYEQFRSPLMAGMVEDILMRTGLPARNLEIEITETVAGQHSARIGDALTRLTSQGVTIAIDDYGTDYTTLGRLHTFPFHRVKIDKTFVDGIRGRDEKSLVIIQNIVSLVRGLGIGVIAEGVETLEQVKYLHALGCDEIQGFFFYRPLAAQEVLSVLNAPPSRVDFLADPVPRLAERSPDGTDMDG